MTGYVVATWLLDSVKKNKCRYCPLWWWVSYNFWGLLKLFYEIWRPSSFYTQFLKKLCTVNKIKFKFLLIVFTSFFVCWRWNKTSNMYPSFSTISRLLSKPRVNATHEDTTNLRSVSLHYSSLTGVVDLSKQCSI